MEQSAIEDAIQAPVFLERIVDEGSNQRGLYVVKPSAVAKKGEGFTLGANLWLAPGFIADQANTPTAVAHLFAETIAGDLDELRINGDTGSEDTFLAMCDGARKLRRRNVRLGLVGVEAVEMKVQKDRALRINILLRVVA